ncbi:hypothetical protein ACEF39_002493 [Stenotrophomonas indicatrix]
MQNSSAFCVVTLVGGLALASSAHATDSWVIFAGGDKPNREAWVVDAQTLSSRADLLGFLQRATPEEQNAYLKQLRRKKPPKPGEPVAGPDPVYEIQVNTVYENAIKPNRLIRKYSVNCARNTVAMKMSLVQWRDRAIEDIPPERFDPTSEAVEPWQVQLVRFACLVGPDPKAKVPAEMMKRGFLPIGDVGQSPANFIWGNLWKDGTRPAFTYRPTDAEMDRAERSLEANLARGQKETARVLDESLRAANRVGRNNLMDMWIGKTEQEFVRTWGTPDRVENGADGSRTLYLHRGERVQGLNVYGHVVSDVNNRCDITVLTMDGYVRDYATQGATCAQQLR